MKPDERQNQTGNDVDARLRRMASDIAVPDDFRRRLRMQLRHNLRYHQQRRRRTWALSLSTVVLMTFLGTNMYLGSDSFEMLEADSSFSETKRLTSASGQRSYGYPAELDDGTRDFAKEAESVHRQKMAGEGKLVMVEGWTYDGVVDLSSTTRHLVDGRTVEVATSITNGLPDDFRAYLKFIQEDADALITHLKNGGADRIEFETRVVEDREVTLQKWYTHHPRWGDLVYWEGYPVD
jgi:hypothetical protein